MKLVVLGSGALAEAIAEVAEVDTISPANAGRALVDVDVAIVLSAGALDVARAAEVSTVVAVVPGLDMGAVRGLVDADAVVLAHSELEDIAIGAGVPSRRLHVAGSLAPRLFVPGQDRAALRRAEAIEEPRVGIVPASLLEAHGANSLLVQLGLVAGEIRWLFDVGRDVEAAGALRKLVPVHGLAASMFADTEDAPRRWQLADLVICDVNDGAVAKGLAVGAALALVADSSRAKRAGAVVVASGAGRLITALPTLAVDVDALVEDDALARAQQASLDLAAATTAERIVAIAGAAHAKRREAGRALPRGLPTGLEVLDDDVLEPHRPPPEHGDDPATGPKPNAPPSSEPQSSDEAIEDELAALKRLHGSGEEGSEPDA